MAPMPDELRAHLTTLLQQALTVAQAATEAYAALKACQATAPTHQFPSGPLTLDDVVAHTTSRAAEEQYALTEERLRKAWEATSHAKQHVIRQLLDAGIPQERWVQCGASAVGISYSNWGGHTFDVQVAPAQGPFPSLNHRYSGN